MAALPNEIFAASPIAGRCSIHKQLSFHPRKKTVTSLHPNSNRTPSPAAFTGGFSPLFSNATAAYALPAHKADPASAQKRSEPNGDHHLRFVDLDDAAPQN